MTRSIKGRLLSLEAKLFNRNLPVSWRDCVFDIFWQGGAARKEFWRTAEVDSRPGNPVVARYRGYEIYYPENVNRSVLADSFMEILTSYHGHYYFEEPTPVLPGDIVLDVGACEGLFAIHCIKKFGASHVYAFEPSSIMSDLINRSTLASGVSQVTTVRRLVGEKTSQLFFYEDLARPALSRIVSNDEIIKLQDQPESRIKLESVPCTSIDDWFFESGIERVDYIKCDAEGADLDILKGAKSVIYKFRPRLAFTTYHHFSHASEMMNWLQEQQLGYKARFCGLYCPEGEKPRPVMLHASV